MFSIIIFDEITSGFIDNYGGLHLKLKVNPDIAFFGKSIGNVLNGIAQGSIAAIKAAFPGGESPMEAFKRVYGEVTSGQEPRMPEEETIEEGDTIQNGDETNITNNTTNNTIEAQPNGALQETINDIDNVETGGAVNTIIQDNKTVTNNTTNNTEQTPDLSVDATDAVAKALAFRGYGMAY